MADNVNIKDFAGISVPVSTEDVTTLNGGVVATQQVQRVAVALRTADATAIDLPGDAANGLDVDVTRLPAVTNGGTFAVQVDGAALTALQLLDNCISGSEAQVDVVSVIPGVGATNLGKAVDSAAGGTDTGVAILGKHVTEATNTVTANGDYDFISLSPLGEVRTRDQRAMDFQNCNTATDWAALNSDTANIADSTKHVFGTGAISFDKVDGAANTVYACITDTITAMNVEELFEAGGFVGMSLYLPALTNVVSAFLRLGTDSSNYQQWTWAVAGLTAAAWMNLRTPAAMPDHANSAGTGWNPAVITYVAVGVQFAGETNTLAGILVDHVHAVGGRVTSTDVTTAVSTTVNTANVNLNRIAGVSTPVSGGGEATCLRVTIANDSTGLISVDDNGGALTVDGTVTANLSATDNAVLDAIQTAVEVLDNCISGSEAQVDIVAALPAGTNNIGTVTPYTALANIVSGSTAAITDTTSTEVIAAPGAGVKILITSIAVSNSHATVGTFVKILSAATVKLQMYADAVGGGFVINLPVPIPCGTNEAVNVQCATTGANIIANVVGYKVTV